MVPWIHYAEQVMADKFLEPRFYLLALKTRRSTGMPTGIDFGQVLAIPRLAILYLYSASWARMYSHRYMLMLGIYSSSMYFQGFLRILKLLGIYFLICV